MPTLQVADLQVAGLQMALFTSSPVLRLPLSTWEEEEDSGILVVKGPGPDVPLVASLSMLIQSFYS